MKVYLEVIKCRIFGSVRESVEKLNQSSSTAAENTLQVEKVCFSGDGSDANELTGIDSALGEGEGSFRKPGSVDPFPRDSRPARQLIKSVHVASRQGCFIAADARRHDDDLDVRFEASSMLGSSGFVSAAP